jgi:hypothetical protein
VPISRKRGIWRAFEDSLTSWLESSELDDHGQTKEAYVVLIKKTLHRYFLNDFTKIRVYNLVKSTFYTIFVQKKVTHHERKLHLVSVRERYAKLKKRK